MDSRITHNTYTFIKLLLAFMIMFGAFNFTVSVAHAMVMLSVDGGASTEISQGDPFVLAWAISGEAPSSNCSLTGPNGYSLTIITDASGNASGSDGTATPTDPPGSSSVTYTLACGANTSNVTVNFAPVFLNFNIDDLTPTRNAMGQVSNTFDYNVDNVSTCSLIDIELPDNSTVYTLSTNAPKQSNNEYISGQYLPQNGEYELRITCGSVTETKTFVVDGNPQEYDAPSCPYTASSDDFLINFTNTSKLRAYKDYDTGAERSFDGPFAIAGSFVSGPANFIDSANTYNVKLATWDGYANRINTTAQTRERLKLVFHDTASPANFNSNKAGETTMSPDIADNVTEASWGFLGEWLQHEDYPSSGEGGALSLTADADSVSVVHAYWDSATDPGTPYPPRTHSVQPICALVEPTGSAPEFSTSCPWTHDPTNNIYVYQLDGERLRGGMWATQPSDNHHYYPRADFNGGAQEASGAVPYDTNTATAIDVSEMPAGDYTISLAGYDQRSSVESQAYEQFQVRLYDSSTGSNVVAQSSLTSDLDDSGLQASVAEVVDQGVVIPAGSKYLRAKIADDAVNLAFSGTSYPARENSIDVVCARFELTGSIATIGSVNLTATDPSDGESGSSISIPSGGTVNLTWTTSDVDAGSCTLTDVGSVGENQSAPGLSVTPGGAKEYILECTDTDSGNPIQDNVLISIDGSGPVGHPNILTPSITTNSDTNWVVDSVYGWSSNIDVDAEVENDQPIAIPSGVDGEFENYFEVDFDDTWDGLMASSPDVYTTVDYDGGVPANGTSGDISFNNIVAPYGLHTVNFYADSDDPNVGDINDIVETDEGDNDMSSPFTFTVNPPRPPMSLDVNRELILSGDTVSVDWEIKAGFPITCTVSGPIDTSAPITGAGSIVGDTIQFSTNYVPIGTAATTSGSIPSLPLQNSTVFEMSCVETLIFGVDLAPPAQAEVEVVPEVQEL